MIASTEHSPTDSDARDALAAVETLYQAAKAATNCPCGHPASDHPIVWLVAGDATTACRADGCRCLDYDGPDEDDPLAAAVRQVEA